MNVSYNYAGSSANQARFREFPERQQYKIMDGLIENAQRNEDPSGRMRELAQSLRVRSTAHMEAAVLDAAAAMDKPNAGDAVKELAQILGLPEMPVDVALGKLADQLAGHTNPHRVQEDSGTTK